MAPMRGFSAPCIIFLCLSSWVEVEALPGPFKVQRGNYKQPGGYHCGNGNTLIVYPDDLEKGPFPIASFGHGMGGGAAHNLMSEIASMGFVVVAPLTGSCGGHGQDMLDAVTKSQSDPPLHKALGHVDWSRTAITGHSFGGDHGAGAAARSPWLKAAVISHSFEYGKNIGKITIPVMCMSGSSDRRANRAMFPLWKKSKADHKVYASVQGGRHNEPFGAGRLNPYAAHFLACHVRYLQDSCDIIYGNGKDSMCEKVQTNICERVTSGNVTDSPTDPIDENTTTTTTTTVAPVVGVSIRNVGSDSCLMSSGAKKVLTENGDGNCAKFTIVGKAFKSDDENGNCLDWFKGHGWGLWSCHGQSNQQLVADDIGKWCSGSYCVIVTNGTTSTTSVTTITTAVPTTTPKGTTTAITSSTTSTTEPTTTSTSTTTATTSVTTTTTEATTLTTTTAVTTSTTLSTIASTSTTRAPTGPINSGDAVFLRTRSGNGNHVDVEGIAVRARWQSQGTLQALTIEKEGGGVVFAGDVVYFKSHTGAHIHAASSGGIVQARWVDRGAWQAMTIKKKNGETGAVLPDDTVCLASHTGKHLGNEQNVIRAAWSECGDLQAMKIEKEPEDALFSGDSITLLAHTGKRIEVEDKTVGARWNKPGHWQTFTIESYGGRALYAGDPVFIKAHTGLLLNVQNTVVQATGQANGNSEMFILHKSDDEDGPVSPGDAIFLSAHTGKNIEVEGDAVQARWSERGLWQTFIIEKVAGTSRRLAGVSDSKELDTFVMV